MTRRLKWIIPLILTMAVFGCGVSEDEYDKVTAQVAELKQQLEDAHAENTSLNQAILDIYKEREQLLTRIENLEKLVKDEEAKKKASETTKNEAPKYYVVEPADTLGKISQKTGVPAEKIKELNNLKREMLYVGEKLRIN